MCNLLKENFSASVLQKCSASAPECTAGCNVWHTLSFVIAISSEIAICVALIPDFLSKADQELTVDVQKVHKEHLFQKAHNMPLSHVCDNTC